MKKKVRDRLDRIEQALKDLIKEVGKLHPVPHLPALQKPKAIKRTVQTAQVKKHTRTPK